MAKLVLRSIFVICSLCSAIYGLNLDSFLIDVLDETRSALEKERIAVASRVVRPIQPSITVTSFSRFSRRRRYTSANKRIWKPRPRPGRPIKRAPINKFMQATNQIDKGLRDADAMVSKQNVNTLKQQIKLACNSKEYVFARQLLGHTIYHSAKAQKSRGRRRRSISSSTRTVLSDIKNQIGADQFSKLMAFDGMVSLAFAIDTTGSMRNEIVSARRLATDIVNWPRIRNVDYILSPFNDPLDPGLRKIQHGPVSYSSPTEKNKFLTLLGKLRAAGGGDCDEMAIDGIQSIFTSSIQYQSPIYIFTDAGAKDASTENIDNLKIMAQCYQTSLNFFLSNAGCMNKKAIDLYQSLADETGGQLLFFTSSGTLDKMSNFVTQALIGGTNIPVIQNNRFKRSSSSRSYSILVDNSMDVLSTTVMTSRVKSNIQLFNPGGTIQLGSKTDTGKGSLFLVKKPRAGTWRLVVPSSAGEHFVTARAVSEENIDFDFYFLVGTRFGRASKAVTTNSPLKNKQATIIITVPAYKRTVPTSLKMQVVDKNLKQVKSVKLVQNGRSPGRFKGTFSPPSQDFRLILEGQTKEKVNFKRLCVGTVKPTTAAIHVHSAPRGFILNPGSSTITTILFAVNNYGINEAFTVKVKELNKYAQRYPKRLFIVNGRMALFPVTFKAPRGSKSGTTHKVIVSVIGQRSGTRGSILVPLLVV